MCHLTGGVWRPGAVCAAAGPDVGASGTLEGAQAPGVIQGAVAWTRETRGHRKHGSSDTWDPGTEGGDLARAARHMLRAPGLVSPTPVLLDHNIGNLSSIQNELV